MNHVLLYFISVFERPLISEYNILEISSSKTNELCVNSLSIFNRSIIAEGTSRTSKADRRHFFVIARGSTYETYAIIDLLKIESEYNILEISSSKSNVLFKNSLSIFNRSIIA